MDGEKEIKSFISSIKNAIMSTSVETLKEDQLQGVLNSFRDANNASDSGISKYFEIPTSIEVFKGSTNEFLCNVDKNFLDTLKSFEWGWNFGRTMNQIFSCSSGDKKDSIPYHFSIKGINVGDSELVIEFVYTKINNPNPIPEKISFNIPITVSK